MKAALLLFILLSGCASKRYQVCVAVHEDFGCMRDTLSKPDALNVGKAMSALGMDVVVKRKGPKLNTEDFPSHPTVEHKDEAPRLPRPSSNGVSAAGIQSAPGTKL